MRKREIYVDLGLEKMIILKTMLKEHDGSAWTGFI